MAVVEVITKAALAGDLQACRLILERVSPPLKAQSASILIDLPQNADLDKIAETFVKAAAEGALSPDTASQMVTTIVNIAHVIEVTNLKDRLEALEHAMRRRKP